MHPSLFDHSNSHDWPVLPPRPPLLPFPYTALPVQLKTDEAQRLLKRRFESFQYAALIIHHRCGADRNDGGTICRDVLLEDLKTARTKIEEARGQALGWARGQRRPLRYFEPVPPLCLQIHIRSPFAKDYLELICQFDEALEVLHAVRRLNSSRRGHWDTKIATLKEVTREVHITARKIA